MAYRMFWKSKVTGKQNVGPVMLQELEDDEGSWVEPLNEIEAKKLSKRFNKDYQNADHWIERIEPADRVSVVFYNSGLPKVFETSGQKLMSKLNSFYISLWQDFDDLSLDHMV